MLKPKVKIRLRSALLLLLVLAVGYAVWNLVTSPERIKDFVEIILREQMKGRVSLDRVKVDIFRGAEVTGLQVHSARTPNRVVLRVGKLRLRHNLSALLRGRVEIEELVIENPILFAQRKASGEWEIEDIFQHRKRRRGRLPVSAIEIHNAALKLQDERDASRSSDLLGMARLHAAALAVPGEPDRFSIRGDIARSLVGACVISGMLDLQSYALDLVATRDKLPLDENVSSAIAAFLPDSLKPLTLRGGTADLRFDVSYEMAPGRDLDYTSTVTLRDASVSVGAYQIPLSNINGEVQIGRDVVKCPGVSGQFCGAAFTMQGTIARNPRRAATDLTVTVNDLALDDNLKRLAGNQVAALWDQMKPSGHLNLRWRLLADKDTMQEPKSHLVVSLKNCSFTPPEVPLPISDVNGTMEWKGNVLHLKGICGMFAGSPVRVHDATLPVDGQTPLAVHLEVPGLKVDEAFIGRLPKENRKLWENYKLAGTADIHCRLSRSAGPDAQTAVTIQSDWQELRIAYPLLKAPFERLKGRIRMGGGEFIIERAEGFCGSRPVVLKNVRIDSVHPGPLEGTIILRDWAVDDELKSFVPEHLRFVVNDLHPEGLVDVEYRIRPPVGGRQPPPEIALTLRNVRIKYAYFPYEIRNIQGRVIVDESSVRTEGMVAHDGDITFTMPDRTFDTSGHNIITILIQGKNLPVDNRLKSALSEDSQSMWELFDPKGRINVDVRLDCIPGRSYPVVTANVQCNGCELTYKHFPYPIRNVTGTMVFTEEGVRLKGVSGQPASGRLSFGDNFLHYDQTKGMAFDIKGENLRFDDVLFNALPPQFKETWKTISPEGAFDLDWHQERKPGKNQDYVYDVAITLKGCNMKYKSLPYPLQDLRGVLLYDGEKVAIEDITGRSGDARFTILGRVSDPTTEGVVKVKVIGENVPLDDKVRQALPESYHDLWDHLKPGGHISFTCTVATRTDEKGERFVEYEVSDLKVRNARFNIEMPLTIEEVTATASGEVRNDPNRSYTQGEIHLKNATLLVEKDYRFRYDSIRATFYDEARSFHVPYLEGRCYGGKVTGQFTIEKQGELEELTFVTQEFRAEGINIAQIIKDSGLEASLNIKGVEGTAFAQTSARGQGFSLDNLEAAGFFEIKNGQIGDLPKLLKLAKQAGAISFDKTFTGAYLEYDLKDKQAYIKKVDLTGPAFSLHGKGKINFKGDLELVFRPELGSAKDKLPIPLVRDLLPWMLGGVIPVTLTGTVKEPIWKVDPLLPLAKLVKGLARIFEKDTKSKAKPAKAKSVLSRSPAPQIAPRK